MIDQIAKIIYETAGKRQEQITEKDVYAAAEKIGALLYDATPMRVHIMRNWSRDATVDFALHLLGDRCQECGTVKVANLESKLLRVCAACRAQGKITLCEECIAAE